MMKYLDEILEFWLPTKPSRLIAGISILIGLSAIGLPEFLQLLCIKMPDHIALLIRIGAPLLIWLLGSLFALNSVVQYSKTLKVPKQVSPSIAPPIPKPTQFPKEQTDILLILHQQGTLHTFEVAQRLNMEKKEDIVKYHLQALKQMGFVKEISLPIKGLPGQSSWFITDKGKKYLIENKLIS
jgi:hypothetical protein